MRYRLVGLSFSLVCSIVTSGTLSAQETTNKPAIASRDLTGVWNLRMSPGFMSGGFNRDEPPMTAWAEEKFKVNKPSFGPRAVEDSNDPVNPTSLSAVGCFPPGVPRIYLQPFPMEIIQTPERVLMFFEFNHFVRQIWTDGRPHNTALGSTWLGDSIGKWEGDTLVVDTIGFNDKTWLDRAGHPHSDQLHVIERIRRTDSNALHDDITIDDPKAYAKPWATQIEFQLRPKWNITEMVCEDNVNFDEFLKKEAKPAK
jgi:hypothetical protein